MIICWDNLEKVSCKHLSDGDIILKLGFNRLYEKTCPNCGNDFLGKKQSICCSHLCSSMYKANPNQQNLWLDEFGRFIKKRCNMCTLVKGIDNYYPKKCKLGIMEVCKDCSRQKASKFREENEEYIKETKKKYYLENREYIKEKSKDWKRNNQEKRKETNKRYYSSYAKFDSYFYNLSSFEEIRKSYDEEDLLEVKCVYCKNWFKPTNLEVQHRLSDKSGFYCSEACKKSCFIYGRKSSTIEFLLSKNPAIVNLRESFRDRHSREVQSELRKMCLERDNWTCQRCGKHKDELNISLHCHHIEGILYNPLESTDLDLVITVCEKCHKEIHSQSGCKTSDMRCK